jgi:SAM-dependent methyltransferase
MMRRVAARVRRWWQGARRCSGNLLAPTSDRAVASLSDEEWLEVLIRSASDAADEAATLPQFPSSEFQVVSVGSAGEHALREAWRFWRDIQHYAEALGVNVDRSSTILDFGCGWGRILRFFLRDVAPANLWGVDVDPQMVETCRSTFSGSKLGECNFETVPPNGPTTFRNATFDVVYAYSVFSHLAETTHLRWVGEIARVLKPGGLLVATTEPRMFIEWCAQLRDRTSWDSVWHEHLARFAFVETAAALAAYDRGKFLYAATGGGPARDASFYGEAVIPRQYVEWVWTRHLEFCDFVHDPTSLRQAMIIMQKAR